MAGTEFWLSPNLVRFFLPHIPLLNGTGMIIVVEFLSHVNVPLSARKSLYPPPVKL